MVIDSNEAQKQAMITSSASSTNSTNSTKSTANNNHSGTNSSSTSPTHSFSSAAKALLQNHNLNNSNIKSSCTHTQNRQRSKSTHCLMSQSSIDHAASIRRSLSTSNSTYSLHDTTTQRSTSRLLRLGGKEILALPVFLEQEIRIKKNYGQLGLQVDCEKDEGVNGCAVKSIDVNSAIANDARIKQGDLIVSLNYENMRKISNGTAKAILKRASLTTSDIR